MENCQLEIDFVVTIPQPLLVTMELNSILSSVKQALNSSGHPKDQEHIANIELLYRSLGSSSEIIGEIGLYLQRLEKEDEAAYALAKNEIAEYLGFCREKYRMFL